jgi:hypothetical protein
LCPKLYIIHSSIPEDHSQIKPNDNKSKIKTNKAISLVETTWGSALKRGNKMISSTSKITKIRQTKKNWTENRERWFILEENPHSKGLSFSEESLSFLENTIPANLTTILKTSLIIKIKNNS